MTYRRSTAPPSGPWGPTLDRVRQREGWSQTQAFKELRVGLGLGPDSRAAYVSLETGRTPSPDQHDYLVSRFGEPDAASETGLEATETPDALVQALTVHTAALHAQTDAITALVLRLESLAGDAIREGVADALREAGLAQGGEGLPFEQPRERFGESPHQ